MGGSSSYCSKESVIGSHCAFEPTQMCATDRAPGSVSRVPRRTRINERAAKRPYMGDPQREQKARKLRGEDSNSETCSAPAVTRNSSSRTEALVMKAAPVVRRHIEQWQ